MSKTKHQRGLCVFHGCKNIGTVHPNETQCFCQSHWDAFEQDRKRHEQEMQEIHERAEQKRAQIGDRQ